MFVIILASLFSYKYIKFSQFSWKIPQEKHILFMGASHIHHAINDSIMSSAVNYAAPSERYMFTYIKLEHILPNNPQIDTIFLELAPTDLWKSTDDKYHKENEQSNYVRNYWPLFNFEQWYLYRSEPQQVFNIVLNSLHDVRVSYSSWWENRGGYGYRTDSLKLEDFDPHMVESDGWSNTTNYLYLRKIINLCKEYRIKLYFLETPTYHPELFYDQDYYYNAYKNNFSEIELLDYSHQDIPLNEYADAHHLNDKGARHFTEIIKKRFRIK